MVVYLSIIRTLRTRGVLSLRALPAINVNIVDVTIPARGAPIPALLAFRHLSPASAWLAQAFDMSIENPMIKGSGCSCSIVDSHNYSH
jgi:hypothetical protein